MKRLLFFIFASSIFLQAQALLPPLYQTSSEIKAIMDNPQLAQKLQAGEVIEKIEKNDQGYEITTNKSRVQVNVVYEPTGQVAGPAHYKLSFGNPAPL
jgi:hypothetical protein